MSDSGITIEGYFGEDASISITSEINGIKVVAIGEYAFAGCSSLTSIGDDAFYGCGSSLTIYSYIGFYAQSYAKQHSLLFKVIDGTDISSSDITVKTIKNQLYTGKQIKPEVILNQANKNLNVMF